MTQGSLSINWRLCPASPVPLTVLPVTSASVWTQGPASARPLSRISHQFPGQGPCALQNTSNRLQDVGFCRGWRLLPSRTLWSLGLYLRAPVLSGADPPAATGFPTMCPGPCVSQAPQRDQWVMPVDQEVHFTQSACMLLDSAGQAGDSQGRWKAGVSSWGASVLLCRPFSA